MPYKKKRNYKRKPKRKTNNTRIKYSPGQRGISDSMSMKLSYTGDLVNSYSTNAFVTDHNWLMNSVYDPDSTGGGGQPKYHDQMTLLYKYYIVTGVKVKLTGCVNSASTGACNFVMFPDTAIYGPDSQRNVMDKNRTVSRVINHDKPIFKLNKFYKMHDILGITAQHYKSDNQYRASVGGNPPFSVFLTTGCCSFNGAAIASVDYSISFTFYVKYFDRRILSDV